jgi:pyruvate/2-oxoglutarate dehydrogenase complex dihydrolipoamide acyltransferase (E2) component
MPDTSTVALEEQSIFEMWTIEATRFGVVLSLMGIFRLSFSVAALLTLGACGGSPAAPAAAPAEPATSAEPAASAAPAESAAAPTPEAPAAPPHDVWTKDMTKDQEVAFMKKNVVPDMGPIFKAFNADHYANFGCKTCHGPAYQNPHDYLPKLVFKDGKITAFEKKPEIAKFMAEKVTPAMATAMGAKPFDMQTHEGFGCGGCHTVKMK